MSLIGTWKVKKISVFQQDFTKKLIPVEELVSLPEEERGEYMQMAAMMMVFGEDGSAKTMVKLPEDQVEIARSQGAPVDENGCILAESKEWKEENGKYFYNTGDVAVVDGEEQSPWVKLDFDQDGCLPFLGDMVLLEKI